jgi:hypothetical protein
MAAEAAVGVAQRTPPWVYLAITGTIAITVIGVGLVGLYTIKAITAPLSGGVGGLLFGNSPSGGSGGNDGFKLFKGSVGRILPI